MAMTTPLGSVASPWLGLGSGLAGMAMTDMAMTMPGAAGICTANCPPGAAALAPASFARGWACHLQRIAGLEPNRARS